MKKSIVVISMLLILLLLPSSFAYAASGTAIINYYQFNTLHNSTTQSHIRSMGYTCNVYNGQAAPTVISNLKKATIFISGAHGGPGYFNPNSGNSVTAKSSSYSIDNSCSTGSLKNVKLAMFYSCQSGVTSSTYGNLVDVTYNKGAKCVIGFNNNINIQMAGEWNRLFFEKAKEDTIAESMKHADFWIVFYESATTGHTLASRNVKGNTNNTIY